MHMPVAGSQPAGQVFPIKGVHIPAWQLSNVHRLPSLQAVPSGAGGLEHWPVARSHVPGTWHWSDAVHTTGVKTQRPVVASQAATVHLSGALHFVGFETHEPAFALSSMKKTRPGVAFMQTLQSIFRSGVTPHGHGADTK